MTATSESGAGAGTAAPGSRASAGTKLKAAREAQGLSIAAVAQQLKLAPRQVQALEDDDYGRLPGRTFVRGFARNYARFLRLDPGAVLALLPAGDAAPALQRPGLGPARRAMGELPTDRAQRRSWLRWFFPLLLIVIVAVAGYYEYLRQHGMLRAIGVQHATSVGASSTGGSTARGAAPAPLPNPLATVAAPAPLPNPLAADETASPANETATPLVAETPTPESIGTTGSISVAPAPAGSTGAPLVLVFKGPSWVEVRDASGRVMLKATEAAGTTRSIDGTPPFQVTLGDAPSVGVTFRGRPIDLGPYTRGDVARITLQ